MLGCSLRLLSVLRGHSRPGLGTGAGFHLDVWVVGWSWECRQSHVLRNEAQRTGCSVSLLGVLERDLADR